jgi:hypothetical protein
MTEYKLHTFKALSLPSSTPRLPLSITFHFYLITLTSVLNSFRTFFFTILFLLVSFFLKILLLSPLHIYLPLLFHLISLSFYTFSSSPLTLFFFSPFGLFLYTFPPFALTISLFLSLHVFSLLPLPLFFFLFHTYSLSFFISLPL